MERINIMQLRMTHEEFLSRVDLKTTKKFPCDGIECDSCPINPRCKNYDLTFGGADPDGKPTPSRETITLLIYLIKRYSVVPTNIKRFKEL